LIQSLSDTTRAEVREIHSGTREVLDSIKNTHDQIITGLEQTGDLQQYLPPPAVESSGGDRDRKIPAENVKLTRVSGVTLPAAVIPAAPAVQASAVPGPRVPSPVAVPAKTGDEKFSDSRDVAIKKPPETIF
jgi:hypothetical protein